MNMDDLKKRCEKPIDGLARKRQESRDIERLTKAFKANGGKINVCDSSYNANQTGIEMLQTTGKQEYEAREETK